LLFDQVSFHFQYSMTVSYEIGQNPIQSHGLVPFLMMKVKKIVQLKKTNLLYQLIKKNKKKKA